MKQNLYAVTTSRLFFHVTASDIAYECVGIRTGGETADEVRKNLEDAYEHVGIIIHEVKPYPPVVPDKQSHIAFLTWFFENIIPHGPNNYQQWTGHKWMNVGSIENVYDNWQAEVKLKNGGQ